MLCNRCHKKIPAGEEIQKPGSSGFFRGSWEGYGSEIVCISCTKKYRKRERRYWIIFIVYFVSIWPIILVSLLIKKLKR